MGRKKKNFNYNPRDVQIAQVQVTPIFYRNMYSTADIVANRGSAGSSKSHSVLQTLVYRFCEQPNKKILILRKTLPSMRLSTLMHLHKIFKEFGISNKVKEEKVTLNYYNNSKASKGYGNLIHLGSVDDKEKIKSSEWNIIWIEEATEFSYDDFKTISLYNRAPSTDGSKNQVFVSFNPIDEHHWLRTKLLLDERTMKINGVEEIHSTFRDNPFLPEDTRRKYENLVNQDLNYYRIYGLGEWGKLDDLIYSNWDIVPFNLDIEGEVFFGLDFGYNDPSALVKIIVKGDDVWEEELLYESGLNNQQLVNKLKEIIPSRLAMRPMYCDSAEPDKIDEIRKAGFNARPANKSVLDGIDFVKRMKCHVFDNSPDIIKEKRSYSWCKDKEGHPIDKPVDFMDHLMSAERYAIFTPLRKRQAYSVVWL